MDGEGSIADNSDLPELLAEIASVIGRDAALRMAEARGGQTIYLPSQPRDVHWLLAVIGAEATEKLCQHFGGMSASGRFSSIRLVLPMAVRARRAAALRTALNLNMSLTETAALLGVTERTVSRRRAKLRKSHRSNSRAAMRGLPPAKKAP